MRKKLVAVIAVLFCISLTGCGAALNGSLQRDTLRVTKSGYAPEQVVISEVNVGIYDVDWVAETPDGKKYRCNESTSRTDANCVEKKTIKPAANGNKK
ncbi:MAG: hypothetical protein NDI77_07900 [Geobacteraceae bacterium]|nr:hypothetical protein [Geobacteraceae bacterium]